MTYFQKITQDWFYTGASDRRLALFENAYPLPNGVSYNAYLLKDEKTVLTDTCDQSVREVFLETTSRGFGRTNIGLFGRPAFRTGSYGNDRGNCKSVSCRSIGCQCKNSDDDGAVLQYGYERSFFDG